VTDHDEAVVPLGRRLDALARARIAASAPRPAWAAPLTVALRHIEEVADVLGERFERTESRPGAQQARQADLPAAPPAVPGAWDELRVSGERGDDLADDDLREVPSDVRSRLRREVGRAADLMRVHDGPHADAQARAADADAVTVGRDVHLRQGRWAPRREEGVALLAHEATHVAGLVDPGHAWRRAVGDRAEEALARAREASLLPPGASAPSATAPGAGTRWSGTPEGPGTWLGSPPGHDDLGSAAVSTGYAVRPARATAAPAPPPVAGRGSGMRADVERDLTPAAAPDLDSLRRDVIVEVMHRLRSEIERGA
jgi:Domain of unknown function (DUF4157)